MVSPDKEMVRGMFDAISPNYDFLNHFLSFGIDRLWRSKLVRILKRGRHEDVLDVATGTADLAIAMARGGSPRIVGIDIAERMLEIGRKKVDRKGLGGMIRLQPGDAERIPFPEASFDAVTVAFGVRNFGDLTGGLSEMKRVLRPGGRMLILEFSHPGSFPLKQLYAIYSRFFIPAAGRIVSGSSTAYTYLPESVAAFPSGQAFLEVLSDLEMRSLQQYRLSGGIATLYIAEK